MTTQAALQCSFIRNARLTAPDLEAFEKPKE